MLNLINGSWRLY